MYKFWRIATSIDPEIIPGYGDGDSGSDDKGGNDDKGGGGSVSLDDVKKIVNSTVNSAIANLKKSDLPRIVSEAVLPINDSLRVMNESLVKLTGGGGGGDGSGGSGGNQGGKGVPPEVNAQLKKYDTQISQLTNQVSTLAKEKKEADERAERAERHGAIRAVLSRDLVFASEKAVDTAFTILEPLVVRNEQGNLVAGDNLPVVDFVKDFIPREHAYLLKPERVAGSGAGGSGGMRSGMAPTIEMIKPGMKPEDRASIVAAIRSSLPRDNT